MEEGFSIDFRVRMGPGFSLPTDVCNLVFREGDEEAERCEGYDRVSWYLRTSKRLSNFCNPTSETGASRLFGASVELWCTGPSILAKNLVCEFLVLPALATLVYDFVKGRFRLDGSHGCSDRMKT